MDGQEGEIFEALRSTHCQGPPLSCYSQDRVYLEAGFSRATMSRIENGLVDVQIYTIARIADTIGVSITKLTDIDLNSR